MLSLIDSLKMVLDSPITEFLKSLDYYEYFVITGTFSFPIFILVIFELNYPISLVFLLYIVFIQYFNVYDIVSVVSVVFNINIIYIIPTCCIYCITGIVVSLFKWWTFVRRETEKNTLSSYTEAFKESMQSIKDSKKKELFQEYVFEHKIKIIRWIFFWPITLVNLFIIELYRFITVTGYEILYNKYVDIAMKSVEFFYKSAELDSPISSPKFHQSIDENKGDLNIDEKEISRQTRRIRF